MRDRGILLGTTGPAGNVLKIRPPLVFQRTHADLLLETLDDVLGALSGALGSLGFSSSQDVVQPVPGPWPG
jgi:acetylornithine/succinyldiaminopimelate/putrescine aminotransferase